jgi:uncharacterized membrane protein (UPF0127 family)
MKKASLRERILWMGVPALGMMLFLGIYAYIHQQFHHTPSFPRAKVAIQHAGNAAPIPFTMEIAETPAQQAYGLMFRHEAPPHTGMLFVWDKDQIINMWMKNTYIPLDMLFIRRDGVIEKIIAHTVPFDLTPLSSDEPVRGVIELGGGEAARLGIDTGDKVIYPAFSGP